MKAAVYHGKHDLRVEEVPEKELKDNEVMIQEMCIRDRFSSCKSRSAMCLHNNVIT